MTHECWSEYVTSIQPHTQVLYSSSDSFEVIICKHFSRPELPHLHLPPRLLIMAQKFQYDYLPTGSIRLLRIVSVSPDIVFDVEIARLDENPSYNALSYTWGKNVFTERVLLNEQRSFLNVTPSLHDCLTCLGEYVGTRIWIDAVCINQGDDEEKSRQVQQMTRVYGQAAKVLIWLGPSAEDSDDAMRAMSTYGKEAADAGILNLRQSSFSNWPDIGNDDDDAGRKLRQTRDELLVLLRRAADSEGDIRRIAERLPRVAFARLTHREYFTRVWVKQEVTLANTGIVICGNHSAPLEHFHALCVFYGLLQIWESGEWNAGRITRVPGPFSGVQLASVEDPWDLIKTTIANDAVGYLFIGRRKRRDKGLEPLYRLLHQAYVRGGTPPLGCKMPEDKIWGMSGIACDIGELGLKPNYGLDSPNKVYEDTARALLMQGHVDILKWCRSREGKSPSWVPNWELTIRRPWSEDAGEPIFKPFRKTGAQHEGLAVVDRDRETKSPGYISLRGIMVDTISEVGSSLWVADDSKTFDQRAFIRIVQDLLDFFNRSRHTGSELEDVIWRIPIGDKELSESAVSYLRATQRSAEQFHSLISKEMDSDMMAKTFSYQACMATNFMSRPVLTKAGYVGIAPAETLPGDIVVLLLGGTAPFILRPILAKDGQKDGFLLVGECFVYGMMDGEFNDGDQELDVFEVR